MDYEKFISQLRTPEASFLKEKLQNFVDDFQRTNLAPGQQRKSISSFLQAITRDSQDHIAFMSSSDNSYDAVHVSEGWEKVVMSKVFDKVFSNGEETRSNAFLAKKIDTFRWINERHLDLNINFSLGLEVAQAELLRVNGYRAPRDKLIIFQNVLQLIVDLIKKRGSSEAINNDSLLPTLILVVIRASPPNIISNIKFETN